MFRVYTAVAAAVAVRVLSYRGVFIRVGRRVHRGGELIRESVFNHTLLFCTVFLKTPVNIASITLFDKTPRKLHKGFCRSTLPKNNDF